MLRLWRNTNAHEKIGASCDVKDINSSLRATIEVGAKVLQDAKEVGGGLVMAQVMNDDGNVIE